MNTVTHTDIGAKEGRAAALIEGLGSVAVAFSGGADSSLVAAVAREVLGERAMAVTGVSPSLAGRERTDARAIADAIGIRLVEIETDEIDDPRYAANGPDRCFHCKRTLFDAMSALARREGFAALADGYNADDGREILHGHRAALAAGVVSPLYEAGITKDEVRLLLADRGLRVAHKPSSACLASRIPTGTAVTREALAQVERAEDVLHELGITQVRVRHHGAIARIEVEPDGFATVVERRAEIASALRAIGFRHVALDLDGYRRGSMAGALAPLSLIGIEGAV